ncbi:hypothetical protein GCM10010433_43600 [Streptomyces pulveraceus]
MRSEKVWASSSKIGPNTASVETPVTDCRVWSVSGRSGSSGYGGGLWARGTCAAAASVAVSSASGSRPEHVYVSDVSVIVEWRSVSLIVWRPPSPGADESGRDVTQVAQSDRR